MKNIFLVLIIVLLSSCIMPPKKVDEFKTGNYNINSICTDKSIEETHNLLFSELKSCYERHIGETKVVVQSKQIGSIKQLVLKSKIAWNETYSNLVEIRKGVDSCKTSVDVYEPNFTPINDRSSRIKKWLKGEKVKGCGIY